MASFNLQDVPQQAILKSTVNYQSATVETGKTFSFRSAGEYIKVCKAMPQIQIQFSSKSYVHNRIECFFVLYNNNLIETLIET